jgi:hypothetical protein
MDCRDYTERFLPEAARQSVLSRIPLDITLALDIRGPGGGGWSYRWNHGELTEVCSELDPKAHVIFRMDLDTFEAIVSGRLIPELAFFAQRIELEGDPELALKLAFLFEQFTREFPYRPQLHERAVHAGNLSR